MKIHELPQPGNLPSSSAKRPIVFDVTHLVSRLPKLASSGIDRVDLAYGAHFAGEEGPIVAGVHYGLRAPHMLSPRQARDIVGLAQARWRETPDDPAFASVMAWLAAPPAKPLGAHLDRAWRSRDSSLVMRYLRQARLRILHNSRFEIPEGAIYLNAAQHAFEHQILFRWLGKRRDLRRVFLIHDLLSLDYPEYFKRGNLEVFRRRLDTAFAYGDAFITATEAVRARLLGELRRQGLADRPVHVQPFPSPLADEHGAPTSSGLGDGHPYFVMIGAVEPRKNHLLLLNIWRDLIGRNPNAPRLALVGARGWEHEQVADMLDRCPPLRTHVVELSGVPSANLLQLLRGARALLAPSYDEGYGLSIVEALSAGAPVVASDIPVFREVAQGRAIFLSPLDGLGWRDEILKLSADPAYFESRRGEALRFVAPRWSGYFAAIEAFLNSL
jgi:glycosyltransferase involved in cell wall biosynthesis